MKTLLSSVKTPSKIEQLFKISKNVPLSEILAQKNLAILNIFSFLEKSILKEYKRVKATVLLKRVRLIRLV